jgi:hypothetical protein
VQGSLNKLKPRADGYRPNYVRKQDIFGRSVVLAEVLVPQDIGVRNGSAFGNHSPTAADQARGGIAFQNRNLTLQLVGPVPEIVPLAEGDVLSASRCYESGSVVGHTHVLL